MANQKLEQKIKVIDIKNMPKKVLDVFVVENFKFPWDNIGSTDPNVLKKIFHGYDFLLGTTPAASDSGHNDWSAIQWYENQGIQQEEYFLAKINIQYLIDFITENWDQFKKYKINSGD